ncbi:MAG: class I SAM-dependent methyltransferase, partial [Longimicrobiales bacterium]
MALLLGFRRAICIHKGRSKQQIVQSFIHESNPTTVWDIGANKGHFSRLASDADIHTIAFDMDPAAVEKNYFQVMSGREQNILPLLSDLTNPSPGLGWQNQERASFMERGPVDTVLALALIHHFAITNNLPFFKIADFLRSICRWLIIEFVPKTDSQVQRLLATRKDVFFDYSQEAFERHFEQFFSIKGKIQIKT